VKPHFISISGLAGSGKTTVSSYLKTHFVLQHYSISDFSFAGPLKDALCGWFNWDRQRLDTDFAYKEGDRLDDGSPDPYCQALGMTRRVIMQKFGTEGMREGVHENFWIIMADLGLRLNKIPHSNINVISDARFVNELDWVKTLNGYSILVVRQECPRGTDPASLPVPTTGATLTTSTGHASENSFLTWPHFDKVVVNLIDHNLSEISNMNNLTKHLDEGLIPEICNRFDITGKKGVWDPVLFR
jgi:hypothetical protein